MTLQPGTRLGPYVIVAPIGAGGMGEVYEAKDSRLNRAVAIKVLPTELAAALHSQQRFEREARAVAALSHPNILAIHDIGSDRGISFAVTELLAGETLRQRLQRHLSVTRAVDYILQVARGLAAAHEHGIVHRDLKPENIFVTDDGQIKILDFGLAKTTELSPAQTEQVDSGTTTAPGTVTDPGTVMGTAGYMSPEQVRGQAVDHRTDIFSLGAILYEMLGHRRAFSGDSAIETMNAILKDDPPDLTQQNPTTPPALARLVYRCLEKTPSERFQSTRDVVFALEMAGAETGASADFGRSAAGSNRSRRERMAWFTVAVLTFAVALLTYALIHTRNMAVAPDRVLRLASGPKEGVYDALGRGMAELLSRRLPGFKVAVRQTDGAFQNMVLLDAGEVELALGQNDVVFNSVKTDRVLGHRSTNIAGLAVLYQEVLQLVVRKDAGIRSVADLRGKRVALGLPQSGSRFSSEILLEYFGFHSGDIHSTYVDIAEAVKLLMNGSIDAFIHWRALPSPTVADAFQTGEVEMVSLDIEGVRGLLVRQPFLVPVTIPARVYPNQTQPVASLAVKAVLVSASSLDGRLVEDILTAIFDSVPDLIPYHPRAADISIEHAFRLEDGMSIDLHPGARRFYQTAAGRH
jgi:TRAP transporter TAXI family solute receptor